MTPAGRGRPTLSLFVRLLLFAASILLVSNAISLFMIFKMPPPMPEIYRLSEVEQALRGAALTGAEHHPLAITVSTAPRKVGNWQVADDIASGMPCRRSWISVITPSVPSEPMNSRVRS